MMDHTPYDHETSGPEVVYEAERKKENRKATDLCTCESATACKSARCGCHKAGFACKVDCACSQRGSCYNSMNDLSYIFGINPADRPEEISLCLTGKIVAENQKRPDGARLWWAATADRLWEDTRRSWAGEEYAWATPQDAAQANIYNELTVAEQRALRRRGLNHWLQSQFCGYSYSFCRESLVQGDCTSHCAFCHQCKDWRTWHCKLCNKCTWGLTLACQNCSKAGVVAFHAPKKEMMTTWAQQ
ncbi:hypothetical protein C8R43DRAFT_1043545 [Mycena crocata]|nr:hypothetical protein C8R43DRAFT_1043545 [Mycena crocata]